MVKSTRLISAGSAVRVRPPAPTFVQRRLGSVSRTAWQATPKVVTPPAVQPVAAGPALMHRHRPRSSVRPPARSDRSRHPRPRGGVGRIGLGRARSSAPRARRRRRAAPCRRRALQPPAPAIGGRRRAFRRGRRGVPEPAVHVGSRRRLGAARFASTGRSRTPAAPPGTHSSSAFAPRPGPTRSRSATPATIRPRPCCCA